MAGAAYAQPRPAAPAQVPPAITALQGAWELTTQDGRGKCRITLRANEAKGGRALGFPSTCRRPFPILQRVSAWSVSDTGFIRLNDADGKPVLAFEDEPATLKLKAATPDGATLLMDAQGRPRRFVERTPAAPPPPRVAFDPARAPQAASIPATYGMYRYQGAEICRISLTTDPGAADGRFLARHPVRCRDKGLQVFDVVAWRYTGGRLMLIARRGHEIALVPTAEGEWRKDPPGGSELMLRKMAQ
jgi:hypothetical protein